MAMTTYQKSVYLIIFNTTMISRSVGKTLKSNSSKDMWNFKVSTFRELENLTDKMDMGQLTENDILGSIRSLSDEFGISFGQAQKPIKVILKYHFYLIRNEDTNTKRLLHCPIDYKVVLKELFKELGLPSSARPFLTDIDEETYLAIQDLIQQRTETRIDYDTVWDKQHLQEEGIL